MIQIERDDSRTGVLSGRDVENIGEPEQILHVERDDKSLLVFLNKETMDCSITLRNKGKEIQILLDEPVFMPFRNECQMLLESEASDSETKVIINDMNGNWIYISNSGQENLFILKAIEMRLGEENQNEVIEVTSEEIKELLEKSSNYIPEVGTPEYQAWLEDEARREHFPSLQILKDEIEEGITVDRKEEIAAELDKIRDNSMGLEDIRKKIDELVILSSKN